MSTRNEWCSKKEIGALGQSWGSVKFNRVIKLEQRKPDNIITKIREHFKQIRSKTKRYDNVNWGFPFIAAFLVLLFTAAIFLATSEYFASAASSAKISEIPDLMANSTNFASWAASIADGAYFALAFGVLFKVGNVSSKNALEFMERIKKLKVALLLVCVGRNRMKKDAVFNGSG